ncbi:MAG: hypothetical protein PHV82_06295 [Victivallaceae bacterium]|nr:hypothetical protein [Victivallaceae bacterium]
MISLIKTFIFWLITGIIITLLVTMVLPKLKSKTVEEIPGRREALRIIQQAKLAVKNLRENPARPPAPAPVPTIEKKLDSQVMETSAPQLADDSLKERDARLFKRQCAILDDLL